MYISSSNGSAMNYKYGTRQLYKSSEILPDGASSHRARVEDKDTNTLDHLVPALPVQVAVEVNKLIAAANLVQRP